MTLATTPKRPTLAARRFGYLVAAAIDGALLYVVNGRPGWQAASFLTADTGRVVGLINASLVVSLAANVTYLVRDARGLKAVGDLLTVAVGLAAMVRIWQVFPFDFPAVGFDWSMTARVLLGVGIAGSAVAVVAAGVSLGKAVSGAGPAGRRHRRAG